MDSNAVLLKLIFHKCHLNNFNVFNQIGLIALNCIGETVSAQKQAETSLPSRSASQQVDTTQDASLQRPSIGDFDTETANQIRELEQKKAEAVRDENFDLAK